MSAELSKVIITTDLDLIDSLDDLKETIKAKKIDMNISKECKMSIQ